MSLRTAVIQLHSRNVFTDIDLAQIERVRTQIPCLHHRHPNVYRW
jgi:hypothetical protein